MSEFDDGLSKLRNLPGKEGNLVRAILSEEASESWVRLSMPEEYRLISGAAEIGKIDAAMVLDAFGHPLFTRLACTMIEGKSGQITYEECGDKAYARMRDYVNAPLETRELDFGLGKGESFRDVDRLVAGVESGKITRLEAVCAMTEPYEYGLVLKKI